MAGEIRGIAVRGIGEVRPGEDLAATILDALERQFRLCCEVLKRFEARAPSSETRALVQSLMTT